MGDDGSSTGDRKDASRINRDFLGWLDVQTSGRPFFAFLNFYDAHHPYLSPDPERAIDLGRKPRTPRDFRLIKTWWERDKVGLKPDDLCLARDSYDRCIAYLDDQLGQLFDELAKRGVLEDTLVIVTADHGEHLGERDLYGHGCSVYRPELHVPLLMIAPGKLPEGQVIVEPVSLRDVPLTVLDLLGYANESKLSGQSLAKLAIDGADQSENDRLVLSEVRCPPEDDPNGGRSPASKGPMTSMVRREFHYIQNGDGREELFQIVRDPDERVDLSQNPEMTTILERFRRTIRR
jgi:arylsulfatase A-like enzyme